MSLALYSQQMLTLFAQQEVRSSIIVVVALGVVVVALIVVMLVFLSVGGLWLKAFFSAANVPAMALIGMCFRGTAKQTVDVRIMAVQAGIEIPLARIESAILQGADVEQAILALIRARETKVDLTWEEAIAEDAERRLKEKLFGKKP